jgi:polyferredoxin
LVFFLYLLVVSRLSQDVYLNYSLMLSTEQDLRLEQPVTFFFQIDPLVAISSLFAGQTLIKGFLWAVAVVVLTISLGRVFCGFLCPLGSIHHAVGTIRPALKGSRMVRANQKATSQRIKYFLLIFILAGTEYGRLVRSYCPAFSFSRPRGRAGFGDGFACFF